jgi:hypothetical protein
MKLATLFAIHAIVALVFCVGLLVAPAFWITLYGAQPDPQAVVLIRLVGAVFGGFAVMSWLSRNAGPSPTRDAMVLGIVVTNVLAAGVSIVTALSDVYNQLAWGPVTVFVATGIGFALARGGSGSAARAD